MNTIIEFELEGSNYIELKNLLKASGLCDTGGTAKLAIEQGLVMVDGATETRKGCKVKSGQTVLFGKKQIRVL